MKNILSLLFVLITSLGYGHIYDLSLCAIFKDEGPYLKEWIDYHRIVGVKHFYLFNHASQDNYLSVLQPYIDAGIVELEEARDQPDFNGTQVDCYNRGLIKSRGVSTWVGFIDIDEFIMPTEDVDLAWLLSHYTKYAGVALNWRSFGTSNLERLDPNYPMISQLIYCGLPTYSANVHVKSIVRPELAMQFCGPHNPVYVPGWFAVDVQMAQQEGPLSKTIKLDPIRINHYWTRDEYYFNNFKKPRRLSWGDVDWHFPIILEALNEDVDTTMLRYVSRLKDKSNG